MIEVNSSPGIEGMEAATGVDVAAAMITLLERRATRGDTGTKGAVWARGRSAMGRNGRERTQSVPTNQPWRHQLANARRDKVAA